MVNSINRFCIVPLSYSKVDYIMDEYDVSNEYAHFLGNRTFDAYELLLCGLTEFDNACGTKTHVGHQNKCAPTHLNSERIKYKHIYFGCQRKRTSGCMVAFHFALVENVLKATGKNHLVHNHFGEVVGNY